MGEKVFTTPDGGSVLVVKTYCTSIPGSMTYCLRNYILKFYDENGGSDQRGQRNSGIPGAHINGEKPVLDGFFPDPG